MKRIESDPEEQREMEEALQRQATPSHEQPTEEFNSLAYLRQLQTLQDNVYLQNQGINHFVDVTDMVSEVDCVHWDDPMGSEKPTEDV